MIRVLVADDHSIVRQGIRHLLEEDGGMGVVAEAETAADMLLRLREGGIDVVVMDISMPGRSGLDALKDVVAEFPEIPVLVLSMHPEDQYALRVLRAGAAGYLAKGGDASELPRAIRRVHDGKRYISADVAEQLADELRERGGRRHGADGTSGTDVPSTGAGAEAPAHARLSDREFQVLVGLARGESLTRLAESMSLSVKTISTYRTRLLAKLHLRTNADLTQYALLHGLL